MSTPLEFTQVTARALANVYFDGKVISHAITLADGSKKTLGLIFPGSFRFETTVAERMEITAGACVVRLADRSDADRSDADRSDADRSDAVRYEAGSSFDVPANGAFEISVEEGVTQYVCSYF